MEGITVLALSILITSTSLASSFYSQGTQSLAQNIEDERLEAQFTDPVCKTEQMSPDEVIEIIKSTQTKSLNFVALARAESGFYNISHKGRYRGIFQIDETFHKLDDYCDPAEQVRWLEWKLDQGAPPEKLFPNTYYLLYS